MPRREDDAVNKAHEAQGALTAITRLWSSTDTEIRARAKKDNKKKKRNCIMWILAVIS